MRHSLVVQNIKKQYGKKVVLDDVSIEANSHEIIGLFGPNGAGKTTLFSILMGKIFPDSGQIYLDQKNITKLSIHERARLGIGYLPQESSIFRGLSVEDNIKCVLELYEKDKDKQYERLDYLLSKFNLQPFRKQRADSLSGGERRRVEIARSLAINPRFILLDEPLAAIDPITIQKIKALIKSLAEMNIGIIITDHNVKDTLDIVNRAYLLYKHKVLASGTPKELLGSLDARKLYFGNIEDEE